MIRDRNGIPGERSPGLDTSLTRLEWDHQAWVPSDELHLASPYQALPSAQVSVLGFVYYSVPPNTNTFAQPRYHLCQIQIVRNTWLGLCSVWHRVALEGPL
jgi:hypothetical protein